MQNTTPFRYDLIAVTSWIVTFRNTFVTIWNDNLGFCSFACGCYVEDTFRILLHSRGWNSVSVVFRWYIGRFGQVRVGLSH